MAAPARADGPGCAEPVSCEGAPMSSGNENSTAVVFLCPDCGAVYKAVQQYVESTQLGYFDCSDCNSLVHSWHEVYNYFAWTPVLVKKEGRSPRRVKRLQMNGPRRAPPRWTQEQDNQLLAMAKADMTASEIARSLKRTPGSIYSRLQRLDRGKRVPN